MLGGDSSLNHLVYERGTLDDFREWALHFPGWDYETVLKYFKKSEKILDKRILQGPTAKYHSTEGLLSVNGQTINKEFDKMNDKLLEIFKEIGFETIAEINVPKPNGTSRVQVTITKTGVRASTAQAFLLPVKGRKNLCVVKNALVTKIIINDRKVAVGVKVSINSKPDITLNCKKEVILSAGVFHSPQILMLSGIGPKTHLENLGIHVIEDLPVGTNLQDHITVPVVNLGKSSIITTLESVLSVIDSGTLPLPLVDGTFTLGQKFANLQHVSAMFGASSPLFFILVHLNFNFGLDFTLSHLLKHPDRELLLTLVVNAKPKSRGKVELRSNNPKDSPKIYTRFFSEKEDLTTIVSAIRKINTVQQTNYFKEAGGSFSRPPLPECDDKVFDSDEYWECYAKALVGTSFYPTGTCAMGKVTDNRLRVKGITNLRVIDASIMPTIPCGKTAAITVMIAERAAAFIMEDYGQSQ